MDKNNLIYEKLVVNQNEINSIYDKDNKPALEYLRKEEKEPIYLMYKSNNPGQMILVAENKTNSYSLHEINNNKIKKLEPLQNLSEYEAKDIALKKVLYLNRMENESFMIQNKKISFDELNDQKKARVLLNFTEYPELLKLDPKKNISLEMARDCVLENRENIDFSSPMYKQMFKEMRKPSGSISVMKNKCANMIMDDMNDFIQESRVPKLQKEKEELRKENEVLKKQLDKKERSFNFFKNSTKKFFETLNRLQNNDEKLKKDFSMAKIFYGLKKEQIDTIWDEVREKTTQMRKANEIENIKTNNKKYENINEHTKARRR